MKKHINALLGFVCYTIGVIAAAYYGLWKMRYVLSKYFFQQRWQD